MSAVRNRSGFTLIEAVVALVIMGVVLAALLPALARNMSINTTGDLRTGAVAVAQETLDNLRATTEDDWPGSGTETDVDTGETVYASEVTYEPYCDGGNCFVGAREVQVRVSHNGQLLYQVETVFTSLDPSGL